MKYLNCTITLIHENESGLSKKKNENESDTSDETCVFSQLVILANNEK
jgi:hypothetical protein